MAQVVIRHLPKGFIKEHSRQIENISIYLPETDQRLQRVASRMVNGYEVSRK